MSVLERFQDALSSRSIGYRRTGVSLAVQYCPACGRDNYKVIFRVQDAEPGKPLFGRCQSGSCQTNYSSSSYLKRLGLTSSELDASMDGAFDGAIYSQFDGKVEFIPNSLFKEQVTQTEKADYDKEVSEFFDVSDCVISRYALKRGYHPALSQFIKIDMKENSVVFICYDRGKVVGYQKRFITTTPDGRKTKTSQGFDKTNHILEFPQDAPIAVCEGPFTALSAWQYGYYGVCTFGSGISKQQLELIKRLQEDSEHDLLVAVDRDVAGEKFYRTIAHYFSFADFKVSRLEPDTANSSINDLNDAWQQKISLSIKKEKIHPLFANMELL